MTKVIMNGCNGKMGQTITEICKADADIKIVAGIDLYDGIDNDYPVFSSIDKCDVDADVVIDFSPTLSSLSVSYRPVSRLRHWCSS